MALLTWLIGMSNAHALTMCGVEAQKHSVERYQFAILGNTRPIDVKSDPVAGRIGPTKGVTESLLKDISKSSSDCVVFVGDMVRNGSKKEWKKFEKNQAEFDSADDWIANWKQGNFPRAKGWKFGDKSDAGTGTFEEVVGQSGDDGETDGSTTYQSEEDADADAEDRSNKYGGDPNDYVYVFAHNMMSPPEDSFACMYLRDVFGTYDVPLLTPNLAPDGDEFTVTSALNALDAAVKEAEVANPDKQIRLIASSMGAYVAAVYASRDVNAGRIDRMMLLAPVFKPESVLDSLSAELGVEFTDAFREDLVNHDEYPFVQCSAYVVHGYDDEAAPLDNSLTWVRDASVNMRMGATGKEGIEVGERRLLEVAGMGHGIENALPQIKSKIITFFKLPFVIPEGLE